MPEEIINDKPVKHGQRPGLVFLAIVIFIAVLFLVAGYFLGKNSVKPATPVAETAVIENTSAISPTVSPAASSTASATDETASWKIYTNDTYGFSIKYPADWTVADTIQKSGSSGMDEKLEISKSDTNIDIYIDPIGWGVPGPEIKYEVSVVDNKLILSGRESVPPTGENEIAQQKGRIQLKQGNLFALTLNKLPFYISADDSDLTNEQLIVQILSTFKFTK